MRFAPFLLIQQQFPHRKLADLPGEVRRELSQSAMAARLRPGASVAIGAGSRGVANLAVIVRAAVDWWKEQGMKPFIFPAMGSHGAATAAGQAAVLAKYGVTEAAMGCPVRSSLAVVDLGRTAEGVPALMDKLAYRADGVMVVNRIKWHTDFDGKIESGLFKMMAIGMGKPAGAARYHSHAYRIGGMEAVVRSVGRRVLETGKILGGLAILEDEHHEVGKVAAVGAAEMEEREAELLALVKTWMPRIPVEELDMVIVNEMGKQISGTGMDTKVINRSSKGAYNPWPYAPKIHRVFIRDMHPMSYGNALGVGLADVAHSRVIKKMKRRATYMNVLTSGSLACGRIPMNFPTDRECMERIWMTTGKEDPGELKIGWIRNTQDLSVMALTENLRGELETNPAIRILGEARELEFEGRGELPDWLSNGAAGGRPEDGLAD